MTGFNNTEHGDQYLTFQLQEEIFAFEIAAVREVLEITKVTKVPRTPDYIRGVINLRGHVVPVIDLRLKLGMPKAQDTVDTCIVIVEIALDGKTVEVGMVVDAVQEVAVIEMQNIEPAPTLGTVINVDFLKGVANGQDKFIMILNIGRALAASDLENMKQLESKPIIPGSAHNRALQHSKAFEEVLS